MEQKLEMITSIRESTLGTIRDNALNAKKYLYWNNVKLCKVSKNKA